MAIVTATPIMTPKSGQSWEEYRRQMLEETSRFIEWGLAHPELIMWIPAKPVSQGGFPRRVADWFWSVALCEKPQAAGRWMGRLIGRFRP